MMKKITLVIVIIILLFSCTHEENIRKIVFEDSFAEEKTSTDEYRWITDVAYAVNGKVKHWDYDMWLQSDEYKQSRNVKYKLDLLEKRIGADSLVRTMIKYQYLKDNDAYNPKSIVSNEVFEKFRDTILKMNNSLPWLYIFKTEKEVKLMVLKENHISWDAKKEFLQYNEGTPFYKELIAEIPNKKLFEFWNTGIFSHLSEERGIQVFKDLDITAAIFTFEQFEESFYYDNYERGGDFQKLKDTFLANKTTKILKKVMVSNLTNETHIENGNYLFKKGIINIKQYKILLENSNIEDIIEVFSLGKNGTMIDFDSPYYYDDPNPGMAPLAYKKLEQLLQRESLSQLEEISKNCECKEWYADKEVCKRIQNEIKKRKE